MSKHIINKLKKVKQVNSRYYTEEGELIHDVLEVSYHKRHVNRFETMPAHITLAWEDDAAILWIQDADKIKKLGDGWYACNDGNYGSIEFSFIEEK
jgi:hypothetical protein